MRPFALSHPLTLADATRGDLVAEAMLAPPNVAPNSLTLVKAGGVDLFDLMKEGLISPTAIVSLRDMPDMADIRRTKNGGLSIGAMATLSHVAAHPDIRAKYPALADAVGHSASLELRNLATLGGNLLQRPRCWYFRAAADRCLRKGGGHCFAINGENQYHAVFDNRFCAIVHPSTAATALVMLNATLALTDDSGGSRDTALEDFLIGPDKDVQRENDLRAGEILTAIVLPPAEGLKMAHLKIAQKESFDWPLADVAAGLEVDSAGVCRRASIVLGAAAPTPHRAKQAEAVLMGRRIDNESASEAGRAALNGATPLSMNGYKLALFETLVRRAVLQAAAA